MRCMAGWLVSTSGRSVDRVRTTAITTLWTIISRIFKIEVAMQAYAYGLVDGLIIGFSDGIGGVWRFGDCVPTQLTAIWTLCKAQSTSTLLQHCDWDQGSQWLIDERGELRTCLDRVLGVESAELTNQKVI